MAAGPTDRAIPIEGLPNLRDLGGLPTTDGRAIRPRTLLRSEAPVGLEPASADALCALGIVTTVDLRDPDHGEYVAYELPAGVRRCSLVLHPPGDEHNRSLTEMILSGDLLDYTEADLAELYVELLDEQPEGLRRIVEHLADAENLPALVHCHAGKDRTGLVVAMVLETVGVQREAILADFEATTHYRTPERRAAVEPLLAGHGTDWSRVQALFSAPVGTLEIALEHMGPARDYLVDRAGAEPETLDRLTELLVA